MKKLEAFLEKIFEEGRPLEGIMALLLPVLDVLLVALGILVAVVEHSYFVLAIATCFGVWAITVSYANKNFFKDLNNYLLKTPKATTLIFILILIGTIILSCKCFIGFILSVIIAFMIADYENNKDQNDKSKEKG